ncbi:MAG: SIMPL domain-containing protein [Erysipelotrichaceae bacterium]|nr:SIMPL domain-containing protein [Erysipelotrichaceae bacterium]
MTRTISIHASAQVSAKPDYITLSFNLKNHDLVYEQAMLISNQQLDALSKAITDAGFASDRLKTVQFQVHTEYAQERTPEGNYQKIFQGFTCEHELKLSFSFDLERLSKAISAITHCLANPDLSVTFSLKHTSKLKEDLLHKLSEKALHQATILCESSNVTLGDLIAIDYHTLNANIPSATTYSLRQVQANSFDTAMTPEEIIIQDSATFVWEII